MPITESKPFGIRGRIIPSDAFKDLKEDIFYDGGIGISIYDELIEVGYDLEEDKARAQKIGQNYITSWSFRNNSKIEVDFNVSWRPRSDGKRDLGLELQDEIPLQDRTYTTVMTVSAGHFVLRCGGSQRFSNDSGVAKKAEKEQVLFLVLKYFYDEVLNAERPKVGIYRIIEELERKLGSRERLSSLVGQGKKYVSEVMESVQEHRHSWDWLYTQRTKVKLSEQECIDRTRKLIQAYADSLI